VCERQRDGERERENWEEINLRHIPCGTVTEHMKICSTERFSTRKCGQQGKYRNKTRWG